MSFENATQSAIYTVLSGNITGAIYDDVPDMPAGQPTSNFPYTVIGDDTTRAWDWDDGTGKEITLTLHTWSKYAGSKEVKTILGQIYTLLHRASLSASGYVFTDCLIEFSETRREEGNDFRHGITRVRVKVSNA